MKRIAHITDIHLEEDFSKENNVEPKKNWLKILKDLKEKGIEQIVFGGDIGSAEAHKWFFESVKDFTGDFANNFSLVLGNHDTYKETNKHFKIATNGSDSELYYTREDERYKYIFLDTSTSKFSKEQQAWLELELNTEKKIIIFMHHPVLETGFAVDIKYPLEGKEIVREILHKSEKEINIFCGHLHFQDVRTDKNVTQYVSFASCFQSLKITEEVVIDNGFFGYRIIEFGEEIKTSLVCFDKLEPLSA